MGLTRASPMEVHQKTWFPAAREGRNAGDVDVQDPSGTTVTCQLCRGPGEQWLECKLVGLR